MPGLKKTHNNLKPGFHEANWAIFLIDIFFPPNKQIPKTWKWCRFFLFFPQPPKKKIEDIGPAREIAMNVPKLGGGFGSSTSRIRFEPSNGTVKNLVYGT